MNYPILEAAIANVETKRADLADAVEQLTRLLNACTEPTTRPKVDRRVTVRQPSVA